MEKPKYEGSIFHLAIPSKDIQASMKFYASIGCKIGRFNEDMCIVDFFGNQVVCHLSDMIVEQRGIYPRHFGLVLNYEEFNYVEKLIKKLGIEFHEPQFTRHRDRAEEHTTMFIRDPSGNLVEFKWYKDHRFI